MYIFIDRGYIIPVTKASAEELGFENIVFDSKVNVVTTKSSKNNMNLNFSLAQKAIDEVKSGKRKKLNAIWLETSGCFGEVISLLNAEIPDVIYMLKEFLNIEYFETLQGNQGFTAFKEIFDILGTEYVLIVDGAVPLGANGAYTTLGTMNGKKITAKEAVTTLASKAKHIISVGTCACYGGPTAAKPNVSEAVGVSEFLGRNDVIKIPGCPANPEWVMGILGYLVNFGQPELDNDGRPLAYYKELIHDNCPRRRYFDSGKFAKTFGEDKCMLMLGCKGPMTYAYCPVSRWNDSNNWPIGASTTCIGCAAPGFPDSMQPFVTYGGGQGV